METREVEELLEELESRIERLRALYEQYFMGIEKTEPQVLRKEVERRIWELRREQIRNTGLRFKFQMLVQRYNSFQQYWGRTTREIENGTYRRDVIRTAKRFGEKMALTIAGRRRAEKYGRLAENQLAARARKPSQAPPDGNGAPVLPERTASPAPPGDPAPPARLLPGSPPLRKVPEARPSEPDPEAARRKVAALAAQMKTERGLPAPPATRDGPLDLDLDLESRRPPPAKPERPGPRRPSSGRMKAMQIPPAPGVPDDPTMRGARRRSSATMRAVKAPDAARTPEPAPAPPPGPAPAPAATRPNAPAPAARPRTDDAGLPDQRIRQIYAKYVETRRAGNESTAGVTFEKLAESLRAQAEKLRATHPSRKVDYEVVVKDGKTLLKPILR